METQTLGDILPEAPETANGLGNEIIAKHRKPRSDKGQPRGPRGKGKDAPSNPVNVSENTQAALATLDVSAIKKGVSSLCRATDAVLTRKTYRTAQLVTKDETFSRNLASEVSMQPEENDLISELTAVVCQRHELLGKFAPEALLVIALGSYGTRVITAFRKLNDIEEAQRKANAPK